MIKIIHNLAKLKYIKTTQGKNGGINMAVDPAVLNLKDMIILLASHFDIVPCFNKEKQNCCIAPVCRLKGVLHEANQAFLAVLSKYTLADMLANQSELRKSLEMS